MLIRVEYSALLMIWFFCQQASVICFSADGESIPNCADCQPVL
jgi:hypothetical protein